VDNTPAGWTAWFCIGNTSNCWNTNDPMPTDPLNPGAPDLPLYVKVTVSSGAQSNDVGEVTLNVQSTGSGETQSKTVTVRVK
jgi:hypothetical protein